MDSEEQRRQYLAQAKAAAAPTRAASVRDLAAYATAEAGDAARMCEAISALSLDKQNYQEAVRALLGIAAQPSLERDVRLAALQQLGVAEFHPKRFAEFHADYIELLRRLATDPDGKLREAALDRLTLKNDPEAQKLLEQTLRKERKAVVPHAVAVQFLARDNHGSALPLFRELAETGPRAVREQALQALASDSKSAGLFERIATDKDERPALREIAALNLSQAAPARFAKMARQVVLDQSDADRVRAAAASAIALSGSDAKRMLTPKFAKALDAAGAATQSRSLKSSLDRLRRAAAAKAEG